MMRWMWWACGFVALQLAVAAAMAANLGFDHEPPFSKYFGIALVPLTLFAIGGSIWHLRTFPKKPFHHLIRQDWRPLVRLSAVMVPIWLQFVALTWMKSMLGLVTPMWADIPLANMEAALLGQDAWRYLPGPSTFLDYIYGSWALVLCFAYVGTYYRSTPDRPVKMLSFFLTIGLLGNVRPVSAAVRRPDLLRKAGLRRPVRGHEVYGNGHPDGRLSVGCSPLALCRPGHRNQRLSIHSCGQLDLDRNLLPSLDGLHLPCRDLRGLDHPGMALCGRWHRRGDRSHTLLQAEPILAADTFCKPHHE